MFLHRVVEYANREDMKNAIRKLDGTELNGRRLRLVEERVGSRHRRYIYSSSLTLVNQHNLLSFMQSFTFEVSLQVSFSFLGQEQESVEGQEPQSVPFRFQISFQVQVSLEVKVPERAQEEVSKQVSLEGGL